MKTKLTIALMAAVCISAFSDRAASQEAFAPQPQNYRSQRARSGEGSSLYAGLSFGEGVYFRYECDAGCETVAVAPADFELFVGYKLNRNFAIDLAAVWALDFNTYGDRLTSLVGFRPGIKILFPGIYRRTFYLRAAVPVLFGVSGENNDLLIGLLLGLGLEWRFGVAGFFLEVDFTPYFVQVADSYYVIPTQGRLGFNLHF